MRVIVAIGPLSTGSEEVHCDIFKRCQTHYDYCSDSTPPKLWVSATDSFLLPAHYHARHEAVPLQAKWDAFYPINYECSGIIDGKNVAGYLPTLEG